ncbi:hypothetical protein SGLAM104S_10619 [Streptomyces glaucescens]
MEVAVEPTRLTGPGRSVEGRVPCGRQRRGVEDVRGGGDRGAGVGVTRVQGFAHEVGVRAREEGVRGREAVEGGQEVRQPVRESRGRRGHGGRGRVGGVDGVRGVGPGDFAFQPPGHRPVPRIPQLRRRLPQPQRYGNGQRQSRCQQGQPTVLLHRLPGSPVAPGQPHRLVIAEPEDHVIGTGRIEQGEGQVRPLRELLGEQSCGEIRADGGGGGRGRGRDGIGFRVEHVHVLSVSAPGGGGAAPSQHRTP